MIGADNERARNTHGWEDAQGKRQFCLPGGAVLNSQEVRGRCTRLEESRRDDGR